MSLPKLLKRRPWRAAAAVMALVLCWGLPALGSHRRAGAAAFGSLALPPAPAASDLPGQPELVVGYYPDYARAQGFLPADLTAGELTNLHYAFAGIDSQGRVVLADPEADLPNLAGLRALREQYPRLRLLLSVGGWERSEGFSDAAATPGSRRVFAQSAVELMADQGLDGIDLDWEFPAAGEGENYILLLEELRRALDARGEQDGRQYLLSAAVSPGYDFLENVRPAAMAGVVDYLFFMGYDLHGPWDSAAGFNAPLDTPGEDTPRRTDSVREGVEGWLAAGVPPGRLVLGMPLYGYRYQLAPGGTGPGSPFTAASSVGYDQVTGRYLSGHQRLYHPAAKVPYLLGEDWFLSYDDPSSIAAKARFAREKGLGGIGFWELSQDREARLVAAGTAAWKNFSSSP